MRFSTPLVALWLSVCLALPAAAQESNGNGTKLVLSQTASREVEQDMLVALLVARAEKADAREAQAAVNEAMTAALSIVAVEGVDRVTGGYRVHERRDDRGDVQGWIAEQELRLRGRDSAELLQLVGRLQGQGLHLDGLLYELSTEARRMLENELTAEALAALRTRAQRVADTLGARVARIETLRIGNVSDNPYPRPMMRTQAFEASDAVPPPTALPDRETVSVGVDAEIVLLAR
jgi:uncharacterized protein